MQACIKVTFRLAGGDRAMTALPTETLADLCRRHGLPLTQMTSYLHSPGGELDLVVRPLDPLESFVSDRELVLYPNRNLDYGGLLGGGEVVRTRPGASTWIRTRDRGGDGENYFTTELITPEQARELVAIQVADALRLAGVRDEPLVVGISGGGDSNALLGALVTSGIVSRDNIHPVMMLGIPDWDKGVERAEAICERNGLSLRRVEERETAEILGFVDHGRDWVSAFERAFPDDDLEVLGVFGVRKVLGHVAEQLSCRRTMVGTNLEDCLADALYYLSRGRPPFPMPMGPLGKIEVVCPLWLTPKALIDGCYPRYSLENYEARYPSHMLGRAYYYYLAQMLVDSFPGAAQELLRGTSRLSARYFEAEPRDSELGVPMMADMPFDLRLKLRALFGTASLV